MGRPKGGRSGGIARLAGPSEITYAEVIPRDEGDPRSPDLDDLPPDRREKIERIRLEIQRGSYESREKLEKAIERLLEEII